MLSSGGNSHHATEQGSLLLCAMLASALVGMVGLLPMAILPWIPKHLQNGVVRSLLAAACGGLLANAWLHLLPEVILRATRPKQTLKMFKVKIYCVADSQAMELKASLPHTTFHELLGPMCTLAGIIVLFCLEKASALLEKSIFSFNM